MKLSEGQRWAAVEVIELSTRYEVIDLGGGCKEKGHYAFVKFRCECGKEFERRQADLRRQADVVDCGCGAGQGKEVGRRGKKPSAEPRIITSIVMALPILQRIDYYAGKNNLSRNKAIAELVQLGLAAGEE